MTFVKTLQMYKIFFVTWDPRSHMNLGQKKSKFKIPHDCVWTFSDLLNASFSEYEVINV